MWGSEAEYDDGVDSGRKVTCLNQVDDLVQARMRLQFSGAGIVGVLGLIYRRRHGLMTARLLSSLRLRLQGTTISNTPRRR